MVNHKTTAPPPKMHIAYVGRDLRNQYGHALNEREVQFLRLACSELTYKEIAERMYLSARTIDGYRDALFDKLNVRTRVGLVMYAIRHGISEP
jgi:DNA-binding CsgD family transcriptional regulator